MTNETKQQILHDVEFLKTFDAPIIEGGQYYKSVVKTSLVMAGFYYFSYYLISFAYVYMGIHELTKPEGIVHVLNECLFETLIFGTIGALVLFVFFFMPMSSKYVLFKYSYMEHLKSGALINKKLIRFGQIIFNVFTIISFIAGSFLGVTLFGNFIALIFTMIFSGMIIDFEITRMGIPSLPGLITAVTGGKE